MFDAYFTSKGKQGTGLGLAIVAGILRHNNAAMWVDTALGKGTCVTVFWPLEPVAAQAPRAMVQIEAQERLDGAQILVVDDESSICDVVGGMLEAAGAEVATTTVPEDALEAIAADPAHWSALVTDHDMPGLTGADLARSVRAIRADLPVILVSAMAEDIDDRSLFDAVFTKPVPQDRLICGIKTALTKTYE
jgi:CheY-like chemotaxis protein